MLMQRSQRETLLLLRVDEGSTILSVSPRSLLVESSNLNWDGCNPEVCVRAHADKPQRREAVRCKSDHRLVVYAPTCALRSSSVAPRVSYTHIRPPFGIWQSRRQGLMNLRCKPICCTVRWPEQTLWGNKLESSITGVHPQFKSKHDSLNLPNLSLQCFPTTAPVSLLLRNNKTATWTSFKSSISLEVHAYVQSSWCKPSVM